MAAEVDLDVEVFYTESEDGKHGLFVFSLPHASVTLRLERNDEGATDGGLLVENLEQIWRNTLERMIPEDLTDPE